MTCIRRATSSARRRARFCSICGNVAEEEQCRICLDPRRDLTILCVVEEPKDVVAIEKTREFRGRYHVLGGAISPIDGVGPDDLRIRELLFRLQDGTITEVMGEVNLFAGLSVADGLRKYRRAIEDICDRSESKLGSWWTRGLTFRGKR